MKDCPQKKKDQEKSSSEEVFSGLNDIAHDFYERHFSEMFHGIIEVYEESEEQTDSAMPVEDHPQSQEDCLN